MLSSLQQFQHAAGMVLLLSLARGIDDLKVDIILA